VDESARYRAFISYSHRDARWGEWIHRKLESYRLPKAIVGRDTPFGPVPERLQPIFRDRDELGTAMDLTTEITAALQSSLFLVVLCSPAAAASRWVNEEVRSFKRLHGGERVRAIILEGEPFSGDPATECFPEALRFHVGADGRLSEVRTEPLAADLRPGGDGRKFAVSKLVAGLTGVRLDELVQRENQRRSRTMRALAAGLSALVLIFAGLALEAVRQRNAARLAQTDAEAARKDAEGLVEFMLTDLRTRLNAVGRLDVLDAVGKRAIAYYDARDLGKADPDALGRRARAQLLVGEIDNLRGDLDSALAAYEAAAATTEEQLARDRGNPQRIFDHAQSVFWVGYIAWQRGDAAQAKSRFTQYHDYAQRLLAIDPDKDEWQMELEFAYSNLGTLALDQGQAAVAEAFFRKSLAVSTGLAERHAGDVERLIAHGQSYAWLADALHRQAKVAEARAARLSELALYASVDAWKSDNAAIRNRTATALYRLAQIEISAGELQEAAARAKDAVRSFDQLLAGDPDNMEQADRTSLAYAVLGEVHLHLGQTEQARITLMRSIEIAERLVARDGSVAQWRDQNLALPQLTLARVHVATNDLTAARRLFATVANHLREPAGRDNADPRITRIYCAALAGQARLASRSEPLWLEIIAALSQKAGRQSPDGLVLLAEANAALGRLEAAQAITSRLTLAGYRHPDLSAVFERYPTLRNFEVAATP
jgi:tetratricopeptide (TPR) repeat protein